MEFDVRSAAAAIAVVAALGGAAPAAAQTASIDLATQADQQFVGLLGSDRVGSALDARDNGVTGVDVILGAPHASADNGGAWVVHSSAAPLLDLGAIGPIGFRMSDNGAPRGMLGEAVAALGDVNGDALADFAVAAPASRKIHVVFGSATEANLDVAALGAGGFLISGLASPPTGFVPHTAVAGAGDVNGDGLGDIIVGDRYGGGSSGDGERSGAAYVVFGKATTSAVSLTALGGAGYAVTTGTSADEATLGAAVADAGDVNRDGRHDQLVGAPGSLVSKGAAYVLFGKADTAPVTILALGAGGYRIDGEKVPDQAGAAVANVGDVNGDGRPDALVGATNAGEHLSGGAYVVHGSRSTAPVSLATLGSRGYRVTATYPTESFGESVAGPGDVNGDGRPDLLIGAPGSSTNGWGSGAAFVVYGARRNAAVDTAALGDGGFRADGGAPYDVAGAAVAGGGDFDANPDAPGRDVLIGAEGADALGRIDSGAVYVIHGSGILRPASPIDKLVVIGVRGGLAQPAASPVRTVRFNTRRPARVTVRLFRLAPGRRRVTQRGVRCVAPTVRLRRAPSCTRRISVGSVSQTFARAGAHEVAIPARRGGRALPAADYLLVAFARTSGGSGHQVARFTVR